MIYWKIIIFSASYLTVQTWFECCFSGYICLLYCRFCYSSTFYLDLPSTWPVCSSVWLFISEVTGHNKHSSAYMKTTFVTKTCLFSISFLFSMIVSDCLMREPLLPFRDVAPSHFYLCLISVPLLAIKLNFPGTRFWLWNVVDFITYT